MDEGKKTKTKPFLQVPESVVNERIGACKDCELKIRVCTRRILGEIHVVRVRCEVVGGGLAIVPPTVCDKKVLEEKGVTERDEIERRLAHFRGLQKLVQAA